MAEAKSDVPLVALDNESNANSPNLNQQQPGDDPSLKNDEVEVPLVDATVAVASNVEGTSNVDLPGEPLDSSDPGFFDNCICRACCGYLKTMGKCCLVVLRLLLFIMSLWTIGDMVMDVLTTKQYYSYGLDPKNFGKCNISNGDYQHLNGNGSTSTVATSSQSFGYFYCACGVWAFTPACYVFVIILWFYSGYDWIDGNDDRLLMIEENFGLIRKEFRGMTSCCKMLVMISAFPIIYMIAILQSYVFTPLILILVGFGNLHPKVKENNFIKTISKSVNFVKGIEGISESLSQCILAMVFYYLNKDTFNCPNSYIPWIKDETILIVSMIFSIGSITVSSIGFFVIEQYGKDWWKALLCQKPEVHRDCQFWLAISWVTLFSIFLTGFLISIVR